ncbi:hypothetical protein CVT25_002708 [Psilocybe cyanescens]|uniref:Uncharacterized protein n=1 Tax=Psilocybe cyanescens TaxID=93625 RepID=A0A409WLZ6_PSICY|nr:hypothetical protein CVT25_002708 [Psilocybe cyanescens]
MLRIPYSSRSATPVSLLKRDLVTPLPSAKAAEQPEIIYFYVDVDYGSHNHSRRPGGFIACTGVIQGRFNTVGSYGPPLIDATLDNLAILVTRLDLERAFCLLPTVEVYSTSSSLINVPSIFSPVMVSTSSIATSRIMFGLRSFYMEVESNLDWETTPIPTTKKAAGPIPTLWTNAGTTESAHVLKSSDMYTGKSFFLPLDDEKGESQVFSVNLPSSTV